MSRQVTSDQVWFEFGRVAALMDELGMKIPSLHLGNSTHRISNKLMHNKTNLWPDGMAGTTKREAYNALRIMTATLAATCEHQEAVRRARARTGL